MSHSDYQMALLLQQQFEHEANLETPTNGLTYTSKRKTPVQTDSKSLIDPSWELIDPTPNIHVLFMAFNQKYFWNKLLAVCVDWSKRMTTCAGICSYQGRAGLCKITLSEPLLKLRPRKDLVETLLHEMIHAYLFVTHNNRDRDGHGPEFHKHMYRINGDAGTSISVYHDFHDEVRLYQQHWWRCNGPCQHAKPFFGMVRRASNRAPGPNDRWWADHARRCGGTFIKVKEPDKQKPKKSGKENKVTNPKNDIRNFYPVLKPNKTEADKPDIPQQKKNPAVTPFVGTGQKLSNTDPGTQTDYATVRNHWVNKFPEASKKRTADSKNQAESHKKLKTENDPKPEKCVKCPICQSDLPEAEINAHLDLCLQEPPVKQDETQKSECPLCFEDITQNLFDVHVEFCNGSDDSKDSNLIPCLVCDKRIPKSDLNAHLDDCMSDNIFKNDSDKPCSNEELDETCAELRKYNCPICFKQFTSSEMNPHLNECLDNDDENNKLMGAIYVDEF